MVSFDLESTLALALDRTLVLSCSGLQVGKALVIGKYPEDYRALCNYTSPDFTSRRLKYIWRMSIKVNFSTLQMRKFLRKVKFRV